MNNNIIVIPTYNEVNNISMLIENIIDLNISLDILFVDDNSVDGTREKIINFSKKDNSIKYLFREKKLGIGSAHKAAFKWCYEKNYKKIITMDGDGTHNPKYILDLIKYSDQYDLVTTTRFKSKDSLKEWPIFRIWLSTLRHIVIKKLLNLHFDSSGAFRAFNTDKIKLSDLLSAKDNGYSFFWESGFILYKKNIISSKYQ